MIDAQGRVSMSLLNFIACNYAEQRSKIESTEEIRGEEKNSFSDSPTST